MEWVGGSVDSLAEESVDAEGELVTALLGEHLPLQDEGHDPGAVRRREEVRRLRRKSGKKILEKESSCHLNSMYTTDCL